MKEKKRIEIEI